MGCSASTSKANQALQPTYRGRRACQPTHGGRGAAGWNQWQDDSCHDQDFSVFADDDALEPSSTAAKAHDRQPKAEMRQDGALSIATRVEYAAIPSGQGQDVFGLVTVQAAATPEPQKVQKDRQPLDIICVLDVSGSMTGEKLELVKKAVSFVIKESQAQDRLSIVAFNHGATRILRMCRMHEKGKAEANTAVSRLTADGGTNIPVGLEVALEVVERRRQRNPVSAIVLLTDGQDSSSGEDFAPLVERAQHAGCSLYAFGFGADHDAQLLSQVAELAQTPFTFVEDVDQIGAAFAGAIGGLASVAAQRVEVSINCGLELKAVHTPFATTREGSQTTVQIPDMLAGERRDILVEVTVPDSGSSSDLLLLTACAKYWDLAAGAAAQTTSAEMHLHCAGGDEPQPELEPDAEVARQRDRWEVTESLKAAAAHGEAGEFEQARTLLASHEARLRGGRKTAISEALVVELQDVGERMSSHDAWEDGGRAELCDAMQMHKMQRATNMSVSKKSRASKMQCKGMYLNSVQQSWISASQAH